MSGRRFLMMRWQYREDRATQAAARLLQLRGGTMSYMKLLKLLYIADRRALAQFGRPITFDQMVSMKYGPVLSNTLNLIRDEPPPFAESYWRDHISPPTAAYEVSLIRTDIPNHQLSPAEEALLDGVFAEFGSMGRWDLSQHTHSFPEYSETRDSSIPIRVHDVLLGQGVSEEDADAIVADLLAEQGFEQAIG